jgi:hypothetical protein
MKIIHYTLGFRPYRSGGLTKYAHDLMLAQIQLGHEVSALYPGGMDLLKGDCVVRYENTLQGIRVYEMLNPLPVSLLYGVKDIRSMIEDSHIDTLFYEQFLNETRPEVMHVHTLMGLPKSFLEIAHNRGIRLVYTSHDYYGLCPKVNLIDSEGKMCVSPCDEKCLLCNKSAKSTGFLRIRNAKTLVPLKKIIRSFF